MSAYQSLCLAPRIFGTNHTSNRLFQYHRQDTIIVAPKNNSLIWTPSCIPQRPGGRRLSRRRTRHLLSPHWPVQRGQSRCLSLWARSANFHGVISSIEKSSLQDVALLKAVFACGYAEV